MYYPIIFIEKMIKKKLFVRLPEKDVLELELLLFQFDKKLVIMMMKMITKIYHLQ